MSINPDSRKTPLVDYERESDTLTIWNGGPAASGFDLTPGFLIVFFDYDHSTPIGLSLTPAAKLLGKHLPIPSIASAKPPHYRRQPDLKVAYDAANDTLRMSNSKPAEISRPLIQDAVTVWFQSGNENIQHQHGKTPSAIVIYNAAKLLAPAILADLAEPPAISASCGDAAS